MRSYCCPEISLTSSSTRVGKASEKGGQGEQGEQGEQGGQGGLCCGAGTKRGCWFVSGTAMCCWFLSGTSTRQRREGSLPRNTTRAGHGQEQPWGKEPCQRLLSARAKLTLSLQQFGKGVLEGSKSLADGHRQEQTTAKQ